MSDLHPINATLLTLLGNQVSRTAASLENLDEKTYTAEPGHDCKPIRNIGGRLFMLRGFMLRILESPLLEQMPEEGPLTTIDELRDKLDAAAQLLHKAIAAHDPVDWTLKPHAPRQGPWGDEPTLDRLVRPFNDFTNHLGSIRALRRSMSDPAEQTQ